MDKKLNKINSEFKEKLELMVGREMTRHNTPGLSIAIVNEHKILYSKGFGAQNLEKRISATKDTIYGIASVTKSLICLGILILEEQGKLKLTDPASKYIPLKLGLKDDPITIHHLMSHSSGIPEIIGQLHEHQDRNGFRDDHYSSEDTEQVPLIPITGWDDFFRHINQAGEYVTQKPGQRFYYQNDGFAMLGRIIEIVSGQVLQKFMKEAVLGPLEMNESTFMQADIDKFDNTAVPYEYIETKKKLLAGNWNVENAELFYAAGGLFSSVSQMANYIMMHLNKGQFKGRQMVSAENIENMHSLQFENSDMCRYATPSIGIFGISGYGYGLSISHDFYGCRLVHHSGSFYGSSAWIAMIPEKNIGVVVLANKHPSPRVYALSTLAMLLGVDVEKDFPLFKYRKHVELLKGEYEIFQGIEKLKVTAKGGQLYLEFNSWEKIHAPLIPFDREDSDVFSQDYYMLTEIGEKEPIQFEIDGNGDVWLHYERWKFKKISV